MACGLGAIILVFMIIKQNVDQGGSEAGLLQADLAQLQQQETALKKSIATLRAEALGEMKKITKTQADVNVLKNETAKKSDVVARKKIELSAVQNTIKNAPKAKNDDVLQNDLGGEENYVMGIKVEGRKIVLLVDSSASMTDEKLIQIIRRKNTSDAEKKRGPKWQRSKRIVRWLLARTPKSSQISVIAYNQTAKVLGGSNWLNSRNADSMTKLYSDLDKLVPTGATNLQLGLQKAASLKPTDLYVLTDGLPTAGQSRYASLNPFAACNSLLGKSNNISGECRVKLFRQSIYESTPKGGVKINVILLPIEGDPQAAPEYWAWSASTGGLLISPALSWP
ncbi:MAG: VWA domain-containing protein [Mariprofundaceae bacterium]|nr:VWA domain-containing protein [Mariprofundaceae bacterium]